MTNLRIQPQFVQTCVFFFPFSKLSFPLTPPPTGMVGSFLGPGGLHFLAKLPEALVNGFHTQPVGDMQSLGSIYPIANQMEMGMVHLPFGEWNL